MMKLKFIASIIFIFLIGGCAHSLIADEHIISMDGTQRLFEVDGSFQYLGDFDYRKVNNENDSVLSTNHTEVKVFSQGQGEVILAQMSRCSNCDFDLINRNKERKIALKVSGYNIVKYRQDISGLYKSHPTYVTKLNELLLSDVDKMKNYCFDYYELPKRRANLKIGRLVSCDNLVSSLPIKSINVI
jgi:hypothetical protein